jgi:OPT family oligopeptide transporter
VWSGIKSAFSTEYRRQHQNDVHNRLMAAYPEVPHWWYGIVFAAAFVLGCVGLAVFLPEAPVWVLLDTQMLSDS